MAGNSFDIRFPDINVLRQLARDQLVSHLENVAGKKDLVLDSSLMKPLDRIAGAKLLKEHGVDKIFKLEPGKNRPGCGQRIFMVRPTMATMKYVADQIHADKNAGEKRKYWILMVPRKLHVCEMILEQEGVFGYVTINEFQLDFIPLDADVLSLETPEFFRSFFLDNDHTWLHTAARSLLNIQQIFGLIPNVYGIGRCAQMVDDLTKVMFECEGEPKQLNAEIGHMFIVDREIDYVTPLCSQVTYEGLLHDTFGIDSGFIEFTTEVTGTDKTMKMLLTSSDFVYADIRNRHFSNVFTYLSGKAKELQSGYDKRHELKSVQDMKSFVANDLKQLKSEHKSLTIHIGACEAIMSTKANGDFQDQLRTEHSLLEGVDSRESVSYVEEIINRQYESRLCLRLLCLISLTQGGLSPSQYKSLKTQYLHSFGFDQMLTFHNLKKLNLYREQEQATSRTSKSLQKVASVANLPKTSVFRSVCKRLQLIPQNAERVNLRNPTDMSYVFSGAFTPILCALVDQILTNPAGTGVAEEVMKTIGAKYFTNVRAKSQKGRSAAGGGPVGEPPKVVLVYFLGGVTFTEIAALRLLGKIKGYRFIIAATSIVNGIQLMDLAREY